MKRSFFRRKTVVLPVLMLAMLLGVCPRLPAMPTGSASADLQQSWDQRSRDEATVRQFLAEKTVRAKLTELGLAPAEVDARLSQLNDQEMNELAVRVDQLHSGGWAEVIIVIAVLAFLGFLIWLIVDHIDHHPHGG